MITLGAITLQVLRLISVCTSVYNVSPSNPMSPQERVKMLNYLAFKVLTTAMAAPKSILTWHA
jgi:hypothetical protein